MSILNKEIYRKDYTRHVEALLFSNNAIMFKQTIKNELSIIPHWYFCIHLIIFKNNSFISIYSECFYVKPVIRKMNFKKDEFVIFNYIFQLTSRSVFENCKIGRLKKNDVIPEMLLLYIYFKNFHRCHFRHLCFRSHSSSHNSLHIHGLWNFQVDLPAPIHHRLSLSYILFSYFGTTPWPKKIVMIFLRKIFS